LLLQLVTRLIRSEKLMMPPLH